jgi:hypothetical protein
MSDVPYSTWTCWLFSPDYGEWSQLLVGFVAGIIMAPYSYGFLYLIIFLFIWEILFAWWTSMNKKYWSWQGRLGIILASILGWFIGKISVDQEIFE